MVRFTFGLALVLLAMFGLGGCTAYVDPAPRAYYYDPYYPYGYYHTDVVVVGGGGYYHGGGYYRGGYCRR